MTRRERVAPKSIEAITASLGSDLETIRAHLFAEGSEAPQDVQQSWADTEALLMVAVKIFAQTNPSKLRAAMVEVEIAQRISYAESLKSPNQPT